MFSKLTLVRKMSCLFAAGVLLGGACLARENAKVKEIVDSKYYAELVKKGEVTKYGENPSEGFMLIPDSEFSNLVADTLIKKNPKNFPYTFEGLYLIDKKEILQKSGSNKSEITIPDVAHVVRSISKMQGMKYYSNTKKKECVLYKKTYMIAGPDDRTRIEDQNTGNADGQVSYCLQDDNSFGINTYRLSYRQNEDTLWCNHYIMDKMGVGPFKAIYKGKMIINILVVDCGEDILLYLNTDVDSIKYPGIKGQIADSMFARMNAVQVWFKTQF